MPWLDAKDPYKIWISEIILQQTRVHQGWSYYERFLQRFPSLMEVYAGGEEEVLKYWEGLGYYSRARNLFRCAVEIVENYQGKFPDKAVNLEKLPGIGPYTAAAIASFAFEEANPVIDGNVFRVISRLMTIQGSPDEVEAKNKVKSFLLESIQYIRPSGFNQALMNFGALICKPVLPSCASCPFQKQCRAYQSNLVASFPAKRQKITKKIRHFHYFIIKDKMTGKVRIQKRNAVDIWKNLYEFPLVESDGQELPTKPQLLSILKMDQHELFWPPHMVQKVKQLLTHQEIRFYFYTITTNKDTQDTVWIYPGKLKEYPMPVTLKKVCQTLFDID